MDKADGAFLTIGELAQELGVPQHVLRYWETRFSQLKPLQRSGNRRYYRPADVSVARRIHALLNVEGFTVRGAQRALKEKQDAPDTMDRAIPHANGAARVEIPAVRPSADIDSFSAGDVALLIARLTAIRSLLQDAIRRG